MTGQDSWDLWVAIEEIKAKAETKDEQVNKLKPVLLQTGKFIEVNGNIINISSIKSITKSKTKEDYDITKVKL